MLSEELEILLEDVARGDKYAFEMLYDRTNKPVFSLLARMLGNRTIAEEVLMELYVDLWKEAASFDRKSDSAFAWLISKARSRAAEKLSEETLAFQSESPSDSLCLEFAQSPAGDLDFIAERQKLVSTVISRFPAGQQQTLALAYFSCLNQKEISDRLGLPLETVKFHLQDGIGKLREQIRFSQVK